jgi:hypothetical protein
MTYNVNFAKKTLEILATLSLSLTCENLYRSGVYAKERGHYCMSFTYVTVFIRKAAYLTQLLIKGSKFRNGNKNFDFGFRYPFLGPSKKTFFYKFPQLTEP